MILDPVLPPVDEGVATARLVEVAIDAAGGAGGRTYTYHAVDDLADVVAGDAVIVEFGRRQALGVVVGDAAPESDPANARPTKPLLARVRSDGPLLPALSVELARWIAGHYLAPLSSVIRAMLPPGMLERLELVAEAVPGAQLGEESNSAADLPEEDQAILAQLAEGARRVNELRSDRGPGRAAPAAPPAGRHRPPDPRLDPDDGRRRAADRPARDRHRRRPGGCRDPGRRWPTRRRRGSVRARSPSSRSSRRTAARSARRSSPSGTATGRCAGLVRRGLVEVATTVAERRPLEGRPVGRRGARPAGSILTPAQAEAIGLALRAIEARDATPLLLEGVTGGGKTAVYVGRSSRRSRPAGRRLVLVPEIALATAPRRPAAGRPGGRDRAPPLAPSATASAPTSGAASARAGRPSSSARGWPSWRRSPISG